MPGSSIVADCFKPQSPPNHEFATHTHMALENEVDYSQHNNDKTDKVDDVIHFSCSFRLEATNVAPSCSGYSVNASECR
jgi:hypothetical protein